MKTTAVFFITLFSIAAIVSGAESSNNEPLAALFDSQIKTLRVRGVPNEIVRLLAIQRDSVIEKAGKIKFEHPRIPFLPVIPLHFRGIHDSMAAVRNGAKTGYTYIHPLDLSDRKKTPGNPYYIFDIENGNETRNKSPIDALKIFETSVRAALTTAEIMALATHTNVLAHHGIWAAGSRFGGADIPYMRIFIDGRPFLGWVYQQYRYVLLGTPSRAL